MKLGKSDAIAIAGRCSFFSDEMLRLVQGASIKSVGYADGDRMPRFWGPDQTPEGVKPIASIQIDFILDTRDEK